MKLKKTFKLGVVVMAVLGFFSIPFTSSCTEPEVTMAKNVNIPLIDATKPAVTETATFAMG